MLLEKNEENDRVVISCFFYTSARKEHGVEGRNRPFLFKKN